EQAVAGYGDRLVIAAHNGPASVVLSGELEALKDVVDTLERQGIVCRMIPGEFAFHSPQMAGAQVELVRELSGLTPRTASVPFFSTVDDRISDGQDLNNDYWGRNLRQPVMFDPAVERLIQNSYQIFLEI